MGVESIATVFILRQQVPAGGRNIDNPGKWDRKSPAGAVVFARACLSLTPHVHTTYFVKRISLVRSPLVV